MVTVSKRVEGDIAVLDIDGTIDGGESCRQIHVVIKNSLESGQTKFVLELSDVEWINSLGIGFIAAAASSTCRAGAELCVASLSSRVDTLLRSCRIVPHVLKDFPDEQAAVMSFQQ